MSFSSLLASYVQGERWEKLLSKVSSHSFQESLGGGESNDIRKASSDIVISWLGLFSG